MSDSHNSVVPLRDRIAAALRNMTGDLTYEAMADAVIAELGLRQQGLRNGFFLVPDPPWDKHRYVTDWRANDE